MQQMSPHYPFISIILLPAILVSLFTYSLALLRLPPHPQQIMPSQASCSLAQEAMRLRQEEDAMAAAILQKEKDAAAKDERGAKEENKKINAAAVTPKNVDKTIRDEAPVVVSSPSVPGLNSLLTGHVSRNGGLQGADGAATMDTVEDSVDDNIESQKKK